MSDATALYWLSFCDPEKPEGHAFLGVVIVQAIDFESAVQEAWVRGINPGGEVMGMPIPSKVHDLASGSSGRLIQKPEIDSLCAAMDAALSTKH